MSADPERLRALFGPDVVGSFDDAAPRSPALARLPVVSPESPAQVAEIVRAASREGWRVLPCGAGEHLAPELLEVPFHFALSSRRLARVVEYEPEEMVVGVEGGVALADLAALAAPHRQRLGPRPPWTARSTVGGGAAADRCGLDRRRTGSWRDAVLGARVVHADGRSSKSGGRVVKNVAGYDLHKLYVGSRGALVVLVELFLRLVPSPASTGEVTAIVPRAAAGRHLLALYRAPLEPAALLLLAGTALAPTPLDPDQVAIHVRFEGRPESVDRELAAARALLGEGADTSPSPTWEALGRLLEPRHDAALVEIACLPVAAVAVLDALTASPAWARGGAFVAQWGVGLAHAQLPAASAALLRALGADLGRAGAGLAVQHASQPPGSWTDAGTLPTALHALHRSTRAALDPQGMFAPLPGVLP